MELPPLDLEVSKNWYIRSADEFNITPLNEIYTGPTEESNWLIPNILLVGAYPSDSSGNPELSTSIQKKLLDVGINTFVCLNIEYGRDK